MLCSVDEGKAYGHLWKESIISLSCPRSIKAFISAEGDLRAREMEEADSDRLNVKRFHLSNRKIVWFSVLIVAILLSLILLYPFIFPGEKDGFGFEITLEPATIVQYTIYCPVPVDASGNPYGGFIDNLRIEEGLANLYMKTTSHGTALEIIGRGKITLRWDAAFPVSENVGFYNLSMINKTSSFGSVKNTTWMYSDVENVSLHFNYVCSYKSEGIAPMTMFCVGSPITRHFLIQEGSLGIGWNNIEIECYETSHLGC